MARASERIKTMQRTITSCMVRRIQMEADKMRARAGVARGGTVVVGNKVYNAVPVIDIYYEDGDQVWCLADDSSGTAVVVGKGS